MKNSIEVYRTPLAVSTEGMDGQDFPSLGQYWRSWKKKGTKLNGKNLNTFQVAEKMKFWIYGTESNKPSKDDIGANIW